MSRGPGKTQRAVTDLLTTARTTEPWPVYLSAAGLARLIYACDAPSAGQLETVRRACRTSSTVERAYAWKPMPAPTRWEPSRIVDRNILVARLPATEAEDWLWHAHLLSRPRSWRGVPLTSLADQPDYRPPAPDELAAAVDQLARREAPPLSVLEAVNALNGATFDAADLERWADLRQQAERAAEQQRARAKTRVATSEQLRLGPYLVDSGTTPDRCPCCRQTIDPVTWDIMQFRSRH